MFYVSIQLFGGRGSGSGMTSGGTSAAAGGGGESVDKLINKTAFTNEGNGTYSLDIPGVGGGQILDETGGSRDPMYGRGGKVYSSRTWDGDYNMIGNVEYHSSLNEAKRAIKDALHSYYGNFG